jgi:hypothetical protein
VLDADVRLARGAKSLADAARLTFMGRINPMLNAPEVDQLAVLDHVDAHGATEAGKLVELVPEARRMALRRTLVWLVKLGVLAVEWPEA